MELWSLLSIVAPGLYRGRSGSSSSRQPGREGSATCWSSTWFRAGIRPFLLRRTKELVASPTCRPSRSRSSRSG